MTTEHLNPTVNLQALDILGEIPTSKYIREKSIEFEKQIVKNLSAFKDREGEIASAASVALNQLRQNDNDIYSVYARDDILRGIAVINHPAAQSVIAESVLDKKELVANTAIRLLTKAETIYPETITFLWQQEATKVKLLSIIEQNRTAGIQNGKVIPELETILLKILEEDFDIKERKRAATITALLHERSNGNTPPTLNKKSSDFLSSEIAKAVVKLSEYDIFFSLVEHIVSANLNAAKSSDITQMEIAIPQTIISEPEEMAAILNRLKGPSVSLLMVIKYHCLLALAKVRARDIVQTRVIEEKEKEERIKTIRQQEDARINQQKATLKQQEEAIRARTAERRRDEEASLVSQALNWFTNL